MVTHNQSKPLKLMFLTTSMPVGGAETLLVNLVRGFDRDNFNPEIVCLKQPGPLGELIADEIPVHSNLFSSKYDIRILPRLSRLMQDRQADAVVTVGAGDKMFWGRLAAKFAGVPVIVSALHSTGWPDSVGRLNRLLTPMTDAFIGVADTHAEHLIQYERFPRGKVHTIHNGVDTDRFQPGCGNQMRRELNIPIDAPVVGILAALRPEKNHELFLEGAKIIVNEIPSTHFLIIGDGPCRSSLEHQARQLRLNNVVHFLGSRDDIPEILRSLDLLTLTSHNEASPVSILEALSSSVPVVASQVGSVSETVIPGKSGLLFPAGDTAAYANAVLRLLHDNSLLSRMGTAGRRQIVRQRSLQAMVSGYQSLIRRLYNQKTNRQPNPAQFLPQNMEPTP